MSSQSSFKQTSIGKIPEEWNIVELKNVIVESKSGFASGERDENGIVQLRIEAIETDGRINPEGYVKVPPPEDVEEYFLQSGDILFNNTNSVDLIGKTAMFRGELTNCVYSNHLTRLRVDHDKATSEWLLFVLIKRWHERWPQRLCHRHVHQAGINEKDLLAMEIPLPPLPEQKKIAEILSTVDEGIQKVDEAIEKTERLKKGLMQELLTEGIGHKEFKETPIGKIPKEWKVFEIGKIADVEGGKRVPKGEKLTDVETPYPYIRVVDFERGSINDKLDFYTTSSD